VELARRVLHGKLPFLDQALGLFERAGVDRRWLVRDVETLLETSSLAQRNDIYIEECRRLGIEVLGALFERSGVAPTDIDVVITTSCTGFMIPALDADLINHFRMRTDVRRLPFTELGCAAGAMALSRAHDHLLAYPDHKVAIVAVEIPSMTYLSGDLSVANLVSSALFGDGAAAALVSNDPSPFELLASRTHFFYDTPEMMGFDLNDDGFRIVLDKRVPQLLEARLPEAVHGFLEIEGLTSSQIGHFLLHPGGRRILDTVRDTLGLREQDLALSRRTLAEVGNLSSASLLWVLAKALEEPPKAGHALLGAFGPGFNAELLLGRFSPDC
jgi:predicted naringenin-chalcone synthase